MFGREQRLGVWRGGWMRRAPRVAAESPFMVVEQYYILIVVVVTGICTWYKIA